ncbi:MAG: [Lachnospiraceae bacterium]|nr:[FeFe] hydrogenase H-cluster radical SAM maturase HydE [Lachnospiraceae bacterium]
MSGNRTVMDRIEELKDRGTLPYEDLKALLGPLTGEESEALYAAAREVRESVFGKDVYLRGLIEISSWCKNDCYYCGIRRSNKNAQRYRLDKEQILDCCDKGYA